MCEEASCPNIGECFGKGTATFMIMGDKCTAAALLRRGPRPAGPAGCRTSPTSWPQTIAALNFKYVVITSVDRDDLKDGGAPLRRVHPEDARVVTADADRDPDARLPRPHDRALDILKAAPPDVMNHNLETAPRSTRKRARSDYEFSLNLLKRFKDEVPGVPTKSGIMVGLGETDDEVRQVMRDMRAHGIDMITIGQYLAPRPPPSGAPLRAPGHVQGLRGRGL